MSKQKPFQYWAACPDFSSGEIIHYITDPDRSTSVTYNTFAKHVDLGPLRAQDHPAMYRISAPSNWAISFHKSKLPNGQPIYYFDWSRIEHIFIDPEHGTPGTEEMVVLAQSLDDEEEERDEPHVAIAAERKPNPSAPTATDLVKRLRF